MNRKLRKWIAFAVLLLLMLLAFRPGASEDYDLSADRIRENTFYLCNTLGIRVAGTEQEVKTADWIADTLTQMGFAPEVSLFRRVFEGTTGITSENVIAVCNAGSEGPLFSVVAHYDSVPTSAGARDNAASVAALLEMAEYLGTENKEFPCEIRLVFLGSEENGYHGSAAYVASLSEEEKQRHMAAFNMDISAASDSDGAVLVCNTLGCMAQNGYQEGNFIVPAQGALTDAVAGAYRQLYGKKPGGVFHFGESDHVSFHNAGLEAANICWRKVENNLPVLPQSYHKPEDTPQELNYDTIRASARCILKAMEILCR